MKKVKSMLSIGMMSICLMCCDQMLNEENNDEVGIDKLVAQPSSELGLYPIAATMPNGKMKIFIERLADKFADGRPIHYVGVRTYDGAYGLVRIGYDAQGNPRSETIETVYDGGVVGLKLDMSHMIICDAACLGCIAKDDGSSCQCRSQLELHGNKLVIVDMAGIPVSLGGGSGSGTGDCALAGQGNTGLEGVVN